MPLIKRNKSFLKYKDANPSDIKDMTDLKGQFDFMQNRCQRLEDIVNDLVVQNSKVLDNNKFFCLELLNARKTAEMKMDKLILFIISYMN